MDRKVTVRCAFFEVKSGRVRVTRKRLWISFTTYQNKQQKERKERKNEHDKK